MSAKKVEKVKYKQIDSARALRDLKFANPNAYGIVSRLREEHACLMKLPVEKVIPLMRMAVEGLIADGICKRNVEDE